MADFSCKNEPTSFHPCFQDIIKNTQNVCGVLHIVWKAGTFSSKDLVQQEDEAEQNHSQLHVQKNLPLSTNPILFVSEASVYLSSLHL